MIFLIYTHTARHISRQVYIELKLLRIIILNTCGNVDILAESLHTISMLTTIFHSSDIEKMCCISYDLFVLYCVEMPDI